MYTQHTHTNIIVCLCVPAPSTQAPPPLQADTRPSGFFSFLLSIFLSFISSSFLPPAARTCRWPLPPGENSVTRLLSPTHSFSALLEVRCKPGFTLPSGVDVTVRRCQGDRQWSGDEPVCAGGLQEKHKNKLLLSSLLCRTPDRDCCAYRHSNSGSRACMLPLN